MQLYEKVEVVVDVLCKVKRFPPKFFVEHMDFSNVTIKQLNYDELKCFGYYETKTLSLYMIKKSIYSAIVHDSVTYFQRRPKLFSMLKDTLVKVNNLTINYSITISEIK